MASKVVPFIIIFSSTFLFLLFGTVLAHPKDKRSSPFEFLHNLKGFHKGDKLKDIHELRKYLETFGYMNETGAKVNVDDFDDLLESAIKNYQLNYNLKATGTLDSKTVSKMIMPRCAVADIINGTTGMRSGKKTNSIHSVSHFSFFPNNSRCQTLNSISRMHFFQGPELIPLNLLLELSKHGLQIHILAFLRLWTKLMLISEF